MIDPFVILTILGVIIALYSTLPERKKLRIVYSFGKLEKVSLILSAMGIIVLFCISLFVPIHCENYDLKKLVELQVVKQVDRSKNIRYILNDAFWQFPAISGKE